MELELEMEKGCQLFLRKTPLKDSYLVSRNQRRWNSDKFDLHGKFKEKRESSNCDRLEAEAIGHYQ